MTVFVAIHCQCCLSCLLQCIVGAHGWWEACDISGWKSRAALGPSGELHQGHGEVHYVHNCHVSLLFSQYWSQHGISAIQGTTFSFLTVTFTYSFHYWDNSVSIDVRLSIVVWVCVKEENNSSHILSHLYELPSLVEHRKGTLKNVHAFLFIKWRHWKGLKKSNIFKQKFWIP